jgi:aspartyl/asparaginyl beta-hydroxylase (cupin superfamily)
MQLNETFKYYGSIDTIEFKKILEDFDFNWDEFDFRQKKFICFTDTKTIPIIFDESYKFDDVIKSKHYLKFEEQIVLLQEKLKCILKEDGTIQSAILVNLPKGKMVEPHIDIAKFAAELKRLHIPILTNEECIFTVGEDSKNLKEGELWEINNDKHMHDVVNNGDTDRIHLIVDWKTKTPAD